MKKLPWSSITRGLVRNFLIFGPSSAAASPARARNSMTDFISFLFLECGAVRQLSQIHRAEHRHALLAQRIVLHLALVVEYHGGPVLGVECRPLGQLGSIRITSPRECDPRAAHLIGEGRR